MVNKRSLEESLDFYCQGELMEGDNQYFCEEAGRKVRPLCYPMADGLWDPLWSDRANLAEKCMLE